MKLAPHLVVICSLMLTIFGCAKAGDESMHMPPGSATTSVKAALAFNEGTRLRETEKEKAIALYTDAIAADPHFEDAYYNRALTHAELGQIEAAESDLDTLKKMNSELVETLEALIAAARDFYDQ